MYELNLNIMNLCKVTVTSNRTLLRRYFSTRP